MSIFLQISFWLSAFVIFWANIGYPLFMILLSRIIHRANSPVEKKSPKHWPTVTILVPVHNEEKVISRKIQNLLELDYPQKDIEILFSSDFSSDGTNEIIKAASQRHKNIKLYIVKHRAGKTNAQNEAMQLVNTEFTVFTDANSMLEKNAIKELVLSFADKKVSYVCGLLCYTNAHQNVASAAESTYWNLDTRIRHIESDIQTITAGNGAIYACRTKEYPVFKPRQGHDFHMPRYFSLRGQRAIANDNAIAYEKASENMDDEFPRKVRMFRNCFYQILPPISIFNLPRTRWYLLFYFGHRSCRYALWIAHVILLTSNITLFQQGWFFLLCLIAQAAFFTTAAVGIFIQKSIFKFCAYYTMTIAAQAVAAFKDIFGLSKPFWEKSESTR